METKNCQNCKKDFTIEPEDFGFYEKIKVPPPTFCPECRMIRRFLFRNDRSFFKRKCEVPGHEEMLISIFNPALGRVVYDQKFWWSDDWNPTSYGRDYDFSKPFFEQFKDLAEHVPLPSLWNVNLVNSDYTNYCLMSKNIYMSTSIVGSEDVVFSNFTEGARDCLDCFKIEKSENIYEALYGERLSNCKFVVNSHDCLNSAFLFDCVNCQNCFMCSNLRNKQFCIRNVQYTKDEYMKMLKRENTGSYKSLDVLRSGFAELIKNSIHKYANATNILNSTGDDIKETKNSHDVFFSYALENGKYIWRAGRIKDSYDVGGIIDSELMYECTVVGGKNYNSKFYTHATTCNNVQLSWFCPSGSNLFGCVGCHGKEYCILNRQYSKEEYEELVPKIIEHMNTMPYMGDNGKVYRYGEFFPSEHAPFNYNETIAQEYFPITKEMAEKYGYKWAEREKPNYKIDIQNADLPDSIEEVPDTIIGKIISCSHGGNCEDLCSGAFKIIPQEFAYYKNWGVPLPRLCPNCRHFTRMRQRNPLKLWHRQCMCDLTNHGHSDKCSNEFETSYAPDRSEKVYCESCYQKEVL